MLFPYGRQKNIFLLLLVVSTDVILNFQWNNQCPAWNNLLFIPEKVKNNKSVYILLRTT